MNSFLSRLRKIRSLARFLYVQRIKGFDPPGRPVLDGASADWLAERLKAAKLYLEFGSGGSTLLANRLGVPSVTVESDRYYAAAVRKVLPSPEPARYMVSASDTALARRSSSPHHCCICFAAHSGVRSS